MNCCGWYKKGVNCNRVEEARTDFCLCALILVVYTVRKAILIATSFTIL